MSTTEQLIRKNELTTIGFIVVGGFLIGWMAALAFAFDTFDLDPRAEPVTYHSHFASEQR
jgi:hypothetical protein